MATGDNSGAIKASSAGLDYNVLKGINLADGVGETDALSIRQHANPDRILEVSEDWISALTGKWGWSQNVTGAAASVTQAITSNDSKVYGHVAHTTGTTSTGRAALLFNNSVNPFKIGTDGAWTYTAKILFNNLYAAGEAFTFVCGMSDTASATLAPANAVTVLYDGNTSANFQLLTAAASSVTILTGTTVVQANVWHIVKLKKAAGAFHWTLEVDGVDQGITSSTNEPSVTAMQPLSVMLKSNGTTPRNTLMDFMSLRGVFPGRG
jgi:hypothetical protein